MTIIMKTRMRIATPLSAGITAAALLLANSIAWAEISSLSTAELTDTYIKDTTVIVRQKKKEDIPNPVAVTLKVSPAEEATQVLPEEQAHSLSSISHELTSYDYLNTERALSNNLALQLPPATTEFLKAPVSESVLADIRKAYGVAEGGAIDLTSLTFLKTLPEGNVPVGFATDTLTSNGSSFTIKIPNLGNFNSQQISSPNGEIGVNVTPSHIEYTLNLPQ